MARLVHHARISQPVLISEFVQAPGSSSQDAVVLSAPTSIPTNNRDVAFVITGFMGRVRPDFVTAGAGHVMDDCAVEVLVKLGGQATNYRSCIDFTGIHSGFNPGSRSGHPFMFVVRAPIYTSGQRLTVEARIRQYVPGPVAGDAEVWGVSIAAFDLTQFTTNGIPFVFQESIQATQRVMPYSGAYNPNATPYVSAAIPWTSGSEQWVTFGHSMVQAYDLFSPYEVRLENRNSVNSAKNENLLFYGSGARMGRRASTSATITTAQQLDTVGLFGVASVDDANFTLEMRGRSAYPSGWNPQGAGVVPTSDFFGGAIFAFRNDAFHAESYEQLTETTRVGFFGDPPNGGSNPHQFTPPIGPVPNQTNEPNRFIEYVVMSCANTTAPFGTNIGELAIALRHNLLGVVSGDLATSLYPRVRPIPAGAGREQLPAYGVASFTARFTNVITVGGYSAITNGAEVTAERLCVLGFYVNDDTPPPPSSQPTPGPRVKIQLGAPAPAVGSLNELQVTIREAKTEDLEATQHEEFETDGGYRVRMPISLRAVRRVTFTTEAMTDAEMEALEDFVLAQDRAAFKFTMRGESSPRAFVFFPPVIESNRQRDPSKWIASFVALELAHTE